MANFLCLGVAILHYFYATHTHSKRVLLSEQVNLFQNLSTVNRLFSCSVTIVSVTHSCRSVALRSKKNIEIKHSDRATKNRRRKSKVFAGTEL
mgnify:CR=1 FL=1